MKDPLQCPWELKELPCVRNSYCDEHDPHAAEDDEGRVECDVHLQLRLFRRGPVGRVLQLLLDLAAERGKGGEERLSA